MRAGEHAVKLPGRSTRQGGSSERGEVVVWAVGIESAPVASGSDLKAIVANRGAEQHHLLQLRQVACDHGGSGGHQCAHDGRGAGRCVGRGVTSAVASRLRLLQPTGVTACLRAHLLMLHSSATSSLDRSFALDLRMACAQAAPASPSDGRAVATAPVQFVTSWTE